MSLSTLTVPTAEVFEPLLAPGRYKGAYGGRGSAKSHFFADLTIDRSLDGGTRIVCIREVQKSLSQSVKRLIEDRLEHFKLGTRHGFKVFKEVIQTPGGGLIVFQGMQDHNAESIKSLEGFQYAWVEEAQTLSIQSLKLLRPTIRGEGSELWFSWNPRRKTDPVDVMLRGAELPTGAIVVNANWSENPWFPGVLEQERLDCLRLEPDQYENVWEGDYVGVAKGAYYAMRLAEARRDGRICSVTEDPLLPIGLYCDIGGTGARSDAFTIWAAQFIGTSIRVLRYYEAQGQDLATHLAWMRKHGYTPDKAKIVLPHDGATNDRVYAVSYESAFEEAGYEVEVIPNQGKGAAAKRIEETRRLFPSMLIDKDNCEGGLDALGWYHEKVDEVRNVGLGPEHDWASHGADAFGLMCVAHETPAPQAESIQFEGWN